MFSLQEIQNQESRCPEASNKQQRRWNLKPFIDNHGTLNRWSFKP
jgi:hypothetical protein